MELGNPLEANEELQRIRPEWRAHPDVLVLRCHIYVKAQKWDDALAIAEGLTEAAPSGAARRQATSDEWQGIQGAGQLRR